MIKPAAEYFTQEVIEIIISEIKANNYEEVTFSGILSRDGRVCEVETIAYGNTTSAPVVLQDVLKGDVLIHNHPISGDESIKEALRPSDADISIACEISPKRIGFYIIDNNCEYVNIVYKPHPRYYLNEEKILSIFSENGLLEKYIANFEVREEQKKLINFIIQAINDSKILLSEAGTGTGKSLSYLIPSAIWAINNKKRVVVSTYTINLQNQIANKDMLIVQKVVKDFTGKNIQYSVLIGRGNYVCIRKVLELINDKERLESLFPEEKDSSKLFEIKEWMNKTTTGIISEIPFIISEELEEEIASDSTSCMRRKCQHFSECFYQKARLDAEKADLLIVNHSLVFSSIDTESKRISLPIFSGIIFDEAHHIEDCILTSLSKSFSVQSLLYNLRKLYNLKNDKKFGFLILLEKKSNIKRYTELSEKFEYLLKLHSEIMTRLPLFLEESHKILKSFLTESNLIGIDDNFMSSSEFQLLKEILSTIFDLLTKFISYYNDFIEEVKKIIIDTETYQVINYINSKIIRLEENISNYNLIFNTENSINYVKWIEVSKRNIKFSYSPLEVGDFASSSIFARKDFTIFTSATLMINNKFDYFSNSIGLPFAINKEKIEIALPSPFNYEEQVEIYLLNNSSSHLEVSEEKLKVIRELLKLTNGGALLLFTSYKRMEKYYELLKEELTSNGILTQKQGEETRETLLLRMNSIDNCALFATSSFWEGIDIPGYNLRVVVIEKIPFDSPTDPIYRAKEKLLESKGENPFFIYSIPRAVLKLKQGIGRLIRTKTDRGIIAILDGRIKTKSYGKVFLKSLPPARIIYDSTENIIKEAKRFIELLPELKKTKP